MKEFGKQFVKFDISNLSSINFGTLEGENDTKLNESFFVTSSIQKLFKKKINYILSPKGGGKSALFRAMSSNLIPKDIFEPNKYSIVNINTAFGFEEDYLTPEKFKPEESKGNFTMAWAIFLLNELINDIRRKHSEKGGFKELFNKLRKVEGFKEKYQLYNFGDYLNNIDLTLTFEVGGQEYGIKPKLKVKANNEKVILNELFKEINEFYRLNNLTALIIVDRIDNFVKKEVYEIQKQYLQSLIYCIEEFANYPSIHMMLFIRTDLFYAFGIDYEFDKLKERVLGLAWEDGETLNFLVRRLLSNSCIKENYIDYLSFVDEEGKAGKHNIHKKRTKPFWQRIFFWGTVSANEINLKRTIDYTVAEKFLLLFLPEKITRFQNQDLCLWIFEHFKDAKGFVNPRILIYFFNKLFEAQDDFNIKFKKDDIPKLKEIQKTENHYFFDIFSEDIFPEVYKKVQNDELISIYKIIKEKNKQSLFKEINLRTSGKRKFNYGDFKFKKFNIEKDEYDRFIKYLQLLGYCKEVENQVYEIPNLYFCAMTLEDLA